MSGVVLRCPNCGTTKAAPGECEACHEAQVRYFCMNHTPGHWLDAPACPQCGARFGDPGRPLAPPPLTPARTPTPASTSTPWRTGATSWRRKAGGGPWGGRKRSRSAEEGLETHDEGSITRDALTARLPELLRTIARARRAPGSATHIPESPPTGLALGGCLIRALFLAVFLLIAFVIMSILVGGSLLQMFWAYY